MARRIIESFVDDIDGSPAAGTTRFAIDGSEYEIDLSDGNRNMLFRILGPYINAGRAVKATRGVRGRRAAGGSGRAISREKSAAIRRWAREHNIPVSERGRIAESVVRQYEAAH